VGCWPAGIVDAPVTAGAERHLDVELSSDLPEAPVVVEGWEPGLCLLPDNLIERVRPARPLWR
jgi:two-component system sensor histidine kinase PrrB